MGAEITCAACGNTDPATMLMVEYTYDHPQHYDGVSEYRCRKCGQRTGRWSGKVLQENESEKRFGY